MRSHPAPQDQVAPQPSKCLARGAQGLVHQSAPSSTRPICSSTKTTTSLWSSTSSPPVQTARDMYPGQRIYATRCTHHKTKSLCNLETIWIAEQRLRPTFCSRLSTGIFARRFKPGGAPSTRELRRSTTWKPSSLQSSLPVPPLQITRGVCLPARRFGPGGAPTTKKLSRFANRRLSHSSRSWSTLCCLPPRGARETLSTQQVHIKQEGAPTSEKLSRSATWKLSNFKLWSSLPVPLTSADNSRHVFQPEDWSKGVQPPPKN